MISQAQQTHQDGQRQAGVSSMGFTLTCLRHKMFFAAAANLSFVLSVTLPSFAMTYDSVNCIFFINYLLFNISGWGL